MQTNPENDYPERGDFLATLFISGITLALLTLAGYYGPALLTAAIH